MAKTSIKIPKFYSQIKPFKVKKIKVKMGKMPSISARKLKV